MIPKHPLKFSSYEDGRISKNMESEVMRMTEITESLSNCSAMCSEEVNQVML